MIKCSPFRIEGTAKPHPKYNADNYENDVAVVKLDKEINFKDFSGTVAPVCLARYGKRIVYCVWQATILRGLFETS